MTYSTATRARYVSHRITEAQTILHDAMREAAKAGADGEELRSFLQRALDYLADARGEASDIESAGWTA